MTRPRADRLVLDAFATLVDEAGNYAGPTDDDNAPLWDALTAAEAQLPALRALLSTVAVLARHWNSDRPMSATDCASDLGSAWAAFDRATIRQLLD